MVLPDVFIDHGHPHKMYELAGLNCASIVRTAMLALGEAQGPQFRVLSGLPAQSAHGF
jgi:hypothetical protein